MKNSKNLVWTSLVGILALGLVPAVDAATPLNAIISLDDPAANMGGARVRVVHASPDAPAVDILVNDQLVFSDVAFEAITDFAEVPADTYNVKVVPAGATEPVVIVAFRADLDVRRPLLLVDQRLAAGALLPQLIPDGFLRFPGCSKPSHGSGLQGGMRA